MANAQTPTKNIKCSECGKDIEVQKWAARIQACDECKSRSTDVDTTETEKPLAEMSPVDKLRKTQTILGSLGFNQNSRGMAKQYQNGDIFIRIEPMFDQGTSMTRDYTLEGIMVTSQIFVPINDPDMDTKIPSLCQADVHAILTELDIKVNSLKHDQVHIDMLKCSRCGDNTAEWIHIDGRILCLAKCAPVKRPYARS